MFQKDMESLRYEISWKDERIEYLQKTLAELEDSIPSSDPERNLSTPTVGSFRVYPNTTR
ncbi:unnamed protein product [Nippostrongylus brasiliensis]|uniref:Transcription factor n=1 Tax=Nippostrongylus brasiliensis TaxID=27835 RepID=A0A0N4XRF2_NIPBR|nr:unnamed protein product [Nippostrongylus brasiliensis]